MRGEKGLLVDNVPRGSGKCLAAQSSSRSLVVGHLVG